MRVSLIGKPISKRDAEKDATYNPNYINNNININININNNNDNMDSERALAITIATVISNILLLLGLHTPSPTSYLKEYLSTVHSPDRVSNTSNTRNNNEEGRWEIQVTRLLCRYLWFLWVRMWVSNTIDSDSVVYYPISLIKWLLRLLPFCKYILFYRSSFN